MRWRCSSCFRCPKQLVVFWLLLSLRASVLTSSISDIWVYMRAIVRTRHGEREHDNSDNISARADAMTNIRGYENAETRKSIRCIDETHSRRHRRILYCGRRQQVFNTLKSKSGIFDGDANKRGIYLYLRPLPTASL